MMVEKKDAFESIPLDIGFGLGLGIDGMHVQVVTGHLFPNKVLSRVLYLNTPHSSCNLEHVLALLILPSNR